MELSDSSADTAAFALHSLHLIVCVVAFLLNVLLFYLLLKFTVFHNHMKIIMINLTLAVTSAVFYLLIRSALGLWQIYEKPIDNIASEIPINPSECAFSESVPSTLCVLFFLFPLLLVIERSYATHRFWDYENENVQSIFIIICTILWIPTIIENASFLFKFSFRSTVSLEQCQYSMMHKTFLQRNIWFIIVSIFSLFYAFIFKFLEKQNKHNEIEYVRHHYSTISIRFQIRENIKTCAFSVSLNLLFFLSFLVFFLFDQNLGNESENLSTTKREYLFLIFPFFAIIYVIHFVFSHSQLFDRAKKTLKNLASIQKYDEEEKMLP